MSADAQAAPYDAPRDPRTLAFFDDGLPVMPPGPRNVAAATSSAPEQVQLEHRIAGLMGKTARVTLKDRRVYEGQLYCYDNLTNLLIEDAHRLRGEPLGAERERIGLIYLNMNAHVESIALDLASAPPAKGAAGNSNVVGAAAAAAGAIAAAAAKAPS